VFVSPLLNGTGVATKIFNAVTRGLPVVTTPLGIHGFGMAAPADAAGRIAVHSDPQEFAAAVVRLLRDPGGWLAQRQAELE
jgi:hypothetical protein